MNKRTIILGALAIVAIIVATFIVTRSKTASPTGIVGGDRDTHGCIGSAGYSWCEAKQKCLRIWEESCYASPAQEVQYLIAQKYSKPLADVTIRVTKQTETHMAGGVSFSTHGRLPEPGESGMFLAVKEGSAWKLVYDGNGSVDCNALKNIYHFPADMLVGICD